MKNIVILLIGIGFLMGCNTTKEIEEVLVNEKALYPIGENGKWGYADDQGKTVIEPIYDRTFFFHGGLGLVKINGKFGYLKKDGSWHIKPKYAAAENFNFEEYASVSVGARKFYINKKGHRIKPPYRGSTAIWNCVVTRPASPQRYFIEISGKYEIKYDYYIKYDSTKYERFEDTLMVHLDSINEFSSGYVLIMKDGKYGLYDIYSTHNITVYGVTPEEGKRLARLKLLSRIKLQYDDFKFERREGREAGGAKVKINNKWGFINNGGYILVETEYDSIKFIKGVYELVLVEFEPMKFGFREIGRRGVEYFERRN